MSNRTYNRLYVNRDRSKGSDKVILGYKNDIREIVLHKDKETVFHVPHFTKSINLNQTSLIENGAIPGPFPAAADRIFKNLQGFGKYTPNGTPAGLAEGGWFCSWLYKNPNGEVMWMDRFYNPGKFLLTRAVEELEMIPPYLPHDPIFYDVPSTMTLESSVEYKYFHVGEKTAALLVDTFAGVNKQHLALDLSNWNSNSVNTSSNSAVLVSVLSPSNLNLYEKFAYSSDRVQTSVINLDTGKDVEISVPFSNTYNFVNEFSLCFNGFCKNWNTIPSTQLAGNYSSTAGYGLFLDTLSSYPMFVIPETFYGHLLYINENLDSFLDKNVKIDLTEEASPVLTIMDTDTTVTTVASKNDKIILIKYDVAGEVIYKSSVPVLQTTKTSYFPSLTSTVVISETPHQLLSGPNDSIILITNSFIRYYNSELLLQKELLWTTENLSITSTYLTTSSGTRVIYNKPASRADVVFTHSYSVQQDTSELVPVSGVLDAAFIEETCWCIKKDGNLYKKAATDKDYILIGDGLNATTISIDPLQRIWVLHDTNKLSIFDSTVTTKSDPLIKTLVGEDRDDYLSKNISFVCHLDNKTNQRTWKAIIYYVEQAGKFHNPQLYICNLKGNTISVIEVYSLFSINSFSKLNRQREKMMFLSKGDFTGYEKKRIFNNISPIKNTPSLVLKYHLRNKVLAKNKNFATFTKKLALPINWAPNSWQHIVLTLKNKKFSVYNNTKLIGEISYEGNEFISFHTRPTFFVGSPVGSRYGLNNELKCNSSLFKGKIDYVKIYNYCLDPKNLEMFLRASIISENLYWEMPTPSLQYTETLERVFKNKIPGSKSSMFNLNIKGAAGLDAASKQLLTREIENIVKDISPMYVNLLKINWLE